MTIPASAIVQVNPGVLAAAGSAIDLNGLILTADPSVPIGGVQPFSNAADVGTFFGLQSSEYQAALIYFAGPNNATKTPGQLYFSQYNAAAAGAFLRSARLTMTMAQLQAQAGTLTVTINGVANTSASINLSGATSFSNAASLIQSGFTAPVFAVTYDTQRGAFLFASSTTGTASTSAYASGPLSAGLSLTQATGAVLSQGAAAATPGTAMAKVIAATLNFACFTSVFEPVVADKIAFSAWSASQGDRFLYCGWDSDVNALTLGSTATWGYSLQQSLSDGSLPIYGNLTHAAFVLSWVASTDVNRLNGRTTLNGRAQSGIVPYVTNQTDYNTLVANGYNFYAAFATANQNFVFMTPGSVSGKWLWADSFIAQIWMNAQIQLALITLLTSAGSIPYNPAGYAMINASCADPINAAINFGAIRTGVSLSAAQVQEIRNAIGSDVSGSITASGYYLQVVPASASIRVARSSPSVTLYYADGGSIQKLTVASIEIQ